VRHTLEAAKAVDFPIQTFGGTKNFLPHALAAWEGRAEAEEARREADARTDEQRRREEEEQERRRRLADRRAEETLVTDGVARTRLGYEVLVKLKLDELLERDSLRMAVEDERQSLEGATTTPRAD
jgi:hypothetical protein